MIVELPGIIINKALGIDGNEPTVSITEIYENLSEMVSDIVQTGYDASVAEVERLISDGGYDRELSMNALINYAQSSAGMIPPIFCRHIPLRWNSSATTRRI